MENDDPVIVSEHRVSFQNTEEMNDVLVDKADITLYAISSTRFELGKASRMLKAEGIKCNIVHIMWLKPFVVSGRLTGPLNKSGLGLVIDAGYEIAGASQSIAYRLNQATDHRVKALGLYDRTKCICPALQNRAPDAKRIYETVKEMLRKPLQ